MKNPTLWIIVVALLIIGGSLFWKTNQKQPVTPNPASTTNPSDIVLYFGDTCPHCKVVEEFINTNKIAEKVSFQQKEVYNNEGNAKEMLARAKYCKLDTSNGVPVPFLWDGQNCLVGQDEAINFFKNKAGLK